MRDRHVVLLGGLGGDSHSVGLHVLRHALTSHGYHVVYLGAQNGPEAFCRAAPQANVVMISSMDGHAERYLRRLPDLRRRFPCVGTLWYLGGNLTIGPATGREREFRELGFDRVFEKFVDVTRVLALLRSDLEGVEPPLPAPRDDPATGAARAAPAGAEDDLDAERFASMRAEVLRQWKTGRAARDLADNAAFLALCPSLARAQEQVRSGARPMLVQPRVGVATEPEQVRLFRAYARAGAGVASFQVDSFTRQNNYAAAEEAVRESAAGASRTPLINGFPVVNHGVAAVRRIATVVGLPLQVRHSTRDPRLLAEISYAGGATGFEGGAICYNVPYYRDYPLAESIGAWKYVDRLTGRYFDEYGIVLDREFFGALTATLIPPCLAIATNLLEAVLAVRQGVRSVSLGYAEQGNRVQDVAAVRAMRRLVSTVLANLGHPGVQVSTVFYQYMAAFPQEPERASQLIVASAATAALSGATRVITKTPVEAYGIPSLAENVDGLRLALEGIAGAALERVDERAAREEEARIEREVWSIFDSVLQAGRGSVEKGIVEGFRLGLLDIPFAPSVHARGAVLTARDTDGAVRFLCTGGLGLPLELKQFHTDRMSERRRAEGARSTTDDHRLVEHDVLRVARGHYARWPM